MPHTKSITLGATVRNAAAMAVSAETEAAVVVVAVVCSSDAAVAAAVSASAVGGSAVAAVCVDGVPAVIAAPGEDPFCWEEPPIAALLPLTKELHISHNVS